MTDLFKADLSDIRDLVRFYRKLPKAAARAAASTLNSMAFADRKQIPETMDNEMIVRSPNIVKRATRVEMARGNQPIDVQVARSGSIEIDRHDAWAHVQKGQPTRITQFTDEGRVGSTKTGKARKAAKAGQGQTTESDFKLKGSGKARIVGYLQAIKSNRARRRKPFYMAKQYQGMPRGIYKFTGGRVKKGQLTNAKIRRLSTPKANVKPKRIDWKQKTTRAAVIPRRVDRWYGAAAKKELVKIKRAVGL